MAVYSYRLAGGRTRWFFIIDLPPDADGRRRQYKRQGFVSQSAARQAEQQARAAYGSADLTVDGTVAAELLSWLAERELDVQETTLSNYRDVVRCYVIPHIGDRQLYTVDKRVLHDLYRTLLKRGGKQGSGLSTTTVRIVHRILMKSFKDLGINVKGVRQPRAEQRERSGRKGVCTPAQSAAFLQHHADHRLRAAWALAIVVGARRGELAGLKWSRVDLDRGVLLLTAGVPVISLHDARHTSATTGADIGVPEHVMQRWLGHADSRTTRENPPGTRWSGFSRC